MGRYQIKPDSILSHILILIKCVLCYHISSDLETEFGQIHAQGIQLVLMEISEICAYTLSAIKHFICHFLTYALFNFNYCGRKVLSKDPYYCHI